MDSDKRFQRSKESRSIPQNQSQENDKGRSRDPRALWRM